MKKKISGQWALKLIIALEESLKLQAHYGELLNMRETGDPNQPRLIFKTVPEWLARLEQTRKFPRNLLKQQK